MAQGTWTGAALTSIAIPLQDIEVIPIDKLFWNLREGTSGIAHVRSTSDDFQIKRHCWIDFSFAKPLLEFGTGYFNLQHPVFVSDLGNNLFAAARAKSFDNVLVIPRQKNIPKF